MWVCGNVCTTCPVVQRTLDRSQFLSSLSPTPPSTRALGDGALSLSGVNIGDVGCYIYDPVEIKSK